MPVRRRCDLKDRPAALAQNRVTGIANPPDAVIGWGDVAVLQKHLKTLDNRAPNGRYAGTSCRAFQHLLGGKLQRALRRDVEPVESQYVKGAGVLRIPQSVGEAQF